MKPTSGDTIDEMTMTCWIREKGGDAKPTAQQKKCHHGDS